MSRLAASFVLGYHGCDLAIARKAITGEIELLRSERDYDWLGPGIYFWEADPQRAREWAEWKVSTGAYSRAAVVGAAIDLRSCLDLSSREDLDLLSGAYHEFEKAQKVAGVPLPKNKSVKGQPNKDRVLRYLDCAVIRHLHRTLEEIPQDERLIQPYDTVRGMFTEGGNLYPGSKFQSRTHTQIAVRNHECIKGIFLLPGDKIPRRGR